MSNFKVGQRVKRIEDPWKDGLSMAQNRTGIVVGFEGVCVSVKWTGGVWGCWPHTLALAEDDPKADAFLESIRKLKPLHEEPRVIGVYTLKLPPLPVNR